MTSYYTFYSPSDRISRHRTTGLNFRPYTSSAYPSAHSRHGTVFNDEYTSTSYWAHRHRPISAYPQLSSSSTSNRMHFTKCGGFDNTLHGSSTRMYDPTPLTDSSSFGSHSYGITNDGWNSTSNRSSNRKIDYGTSSTSGIHSSPRTRTLKSETMDKHTRIDQYPGTDFSGDFLTNKYRREATNSDAFRSTATKYPLDVKCNGEHHTDIDVGARLVYSTDQTKEPLSTTSYGYNYENLKEPFCSTSITRPSYQEHTISSSLKQKGRLDVKEYRSPIKEDDPKFERFSNHSTVERKDTMGSSDFMEQINANDSRPYISGHETTSLRFTTPTIERKDPVDTSDVLLSKRRNESAISRFKTSTNNIERTWDKSATLFIPSDSELALQKAVEESLHTRIEQLERENKDLQDPIKVQRLGNEVLRHKDVGSTGSQYGKEEREELFVIEASLHQRIKELEQEVRTSKERHETNRRSQSNLSFDQRQPEEKERDKRQIEELKDKVFALEIEKQDLEENLKHTVARLEKQNKVLELQIRDITNRHEADRPTQSYLPDTQRQQDEKERDKRQIGELKDRVFALEVENQDLTENSKNNEIIARLEMQNTELQLQITDLTDRTGADRHTQSYISDTQRQEEATEKYRRQIKELKDRVFALEIEKQDLAENSKHYDTIAKLEKQNAALELQIKDITNRLSDDMSVKIAGDETSLENIATSVRPLKIVEEFALLMSGPWLEVKVALDNDCPATAGKEDSLKVELLCRTLMLAETMTKDAFEKLMKKLWTKLSLAVDDIFVKEPNKESKDITSIEENIPQTFMIAVGDKLRRNFKVCKLNDLEKELNEAIIATYTSVDDISTVMEMTEMREYIQQVLQITWKMALQRPRMRFDMSQLGEEWRPEFKKNIELMWNSKPETSGARIHYYKQPILYHGTMVMSKAVVFVS